MTNAKMILAFKKLVSERAAKEGLDISGLKIDGITLDATWGDLCGFAFHGCSDELNERIAKCFEKFASKYAAAGTYAAQRSISLRGARYLHTYTNGATNWSKDSEASPHVALATPISKAYAVSTVYYSGAD